MQLYRCIASFLIVLALAGVAHAQATRLVPVDQAAQDPSFVQFRKQLIEAARRHDARFALSIVDPKIKNGFGGNDGIAEFRKFWRPESRDSRLFDVLLDMLALGGTFSTKAGHREFCAPYVFSTFPQDVDAFENVAVIFDGAPLKAAPKATADMVAHLSYDILEVNPRLSVPVNGRSGKYAWYFVKRADGRKGFVEARYVRSPIDYRAYFSKQGGRWMMRVLVAGD